MFVMAFTSLNGSQGVGPAFAHEPHRFANFQLLLQAPFTYEALPPESISFVPLKQKRSFNGKELMQVHGASLIAGITISTIAELQQPFSKPKNISQLLWNISQLS